MPAPIVIPRTLILLCSVFTLQALAVNPGSNRIRIDGLFDDWRSHETVISDPIGDAKGNFDLANVQVVVDGSVIYLRFDTQASLNLQSGLPSDGNLDIRIRLGSERDLLIKLRERQANLSTTKGVRAIHWGELGFAALPTYATNEFEVRIDLQSLGVPAGQIITLNFEGSDALADAIQIEIQKPTQQKTHPRPELRTKPSDAIRVASLNTLKQGSVSPDRAPSIKKLFDFAGADIYCFNEALDENTFRKSCFDVLPDAFPKTQNVHWSATCGIVSRYPLTPLPFNCLEAAALIDIPGQRNVVIVSAHFTCCGFTGSKKDLKRIREVNELIADLQRMRQGEFGADAANAAVVVLGDYNLVGSRTPLDLANQAGLQDVLLTCPVDGSAMTWRGIDPAEPFWPGRLDYVTIDQKRIQSVGGFIFNTEQLNQFDEAFAADVLASDHSMLVIDLKTR